MSNITHKQTTTTMIKTQESVRWLGILDILKRGRDSNPRPLGYEPNELPLLHPTFCPL